MCVCRYTRARMRARDITNEREAHALCGRAIVPSRSRARSMFLNARRSSASVVGETRLCAAAARLRPRRKLRVWCPPFDTTDTALTRPSAAAATRPFDAAAALSSLSPPAPGPALAAATTIRSASSQTASHACPYSFRNSTSVYAPPSVGSTRRSAACTRTGRVDPIWAPGCDGGRTCCRRSWWWLFGR